MNYILSININNYSLILFVVNLMVVNSRTKINNSQGLKKFEKCFAINSYIENYNFVKRLAPLSNFKTVDSGRDGTETSVFRGARQDGQNGSFERSLGIDPNIN